MQERLKHGFLEKKGFLAPFAMFYRRCRFVDQATKKVVVGWSDAVGAAWFRNKSVPFASVILHPRHS